MAKGGDELFVIDPRSALSRPAEIAVALLVYLVLFHILFRISGLFVVDAGVSAWFPPAGLRFALLLLLGWRFAPVMFASDLIHGMIVEPLGLWQWRGDGAVSLTRIAALIHAAAVPSFSYAAVACALRRGNLLSARVDPLVRVFLFCGGAALAAALTAVLSCLNIVVNGNLTWTTFGPTALAWWAGDFVGILTVAPTLLIIGQWWQERTEAARSHAETGVLEGSRPIPLLRATAPPATVVVEGVVLLTVVAVLFQAAPDRTDPFQWYPIILPTTWLALRFGLFGAVFGILAASVVVATLAGLWGVPHMLPNVEILLVVVSISSLLMGSVVSTLHAERAGLDRRVRERTRDLADEVRRRGKAERAAIEAKQRAERYVAIARTPMVALDLDWRVQLINEEGCRLIGHDCKQILGANWLDLAVPADEHAKLRHIFDKALSGNAADTEAFESVVVTRDGERRFMDWRTTRVPDEEGRVIGTLSSGIDITERLVSEKRIRFLAHHDPVTGLRNRNSMLDRFADAIARARRSRTLLIVLFIDLNGFKHVNDRHGHAAGDHVLAEVARRLLPCVRETDGLTRFGGDEFVVLLEGVSDREAGPNMARKVLEALSRPVTLDDAVLPVGASIGIACFPDHGDTGEALIRSADAAMYTAKRAAGSSFAVAPAVSDPKRREAAAVSGGYQMRSTPN